MELIYKGLLVWLRFASVGQIVSHVLEAITGCQHFKLKHRNAVEGRCRGKSDLAGGTKGLTLTPVQQREDCFPVLLPLGWLLRTFLTFTLG